MKQLWLMQIERFDALSLRERLFLFFTMLVCAGALVDTLWLSPAQTRHKQMSQRVEKQAIETQRLRETLSVSAKTVPSGTGPQAELKQIAEQTEQINQAVKLLLPDPANATPLTQALVHLLRRHDGLTLLHTAALPAEVAGPGNAAQAGKADTAVSANGLPVGLTRQGVALTVSGSYADLARYVQSLEVDMPQVRWGEMNLKSNPKGPPELTLKLFLLGEAGP